MASGGALVSAYPNIHVNSTVKTCKYQKKVAITYMYPAQRDEVVLVLVVENLLLVVGAAGIRRARLLGHDHVRDLQLVALLQRRSLLIEDNTNDTYFVTMEFSTAVL